MSHNLTIKAFFFNSETDYLPYYKNFTITLPDDAIAKDILTEIKSQNETFAFPLLNLVFKINNLVVTGETSIVDIVMKLGSKLKIDPVNTYRSNNGLIINDDDFMKSFELLALYASKDDKEYYKTLYALHYASETENFNHKYIGDAILILAYKMITEGNEHKEKILNAITSVHSGLMDCEYENNLFYPQEHSQIIESLKKMLNSNNNKHHSLLYMIRTHFSKIKKSTNILQNTSIKIENLIEKRIAYYHPGSTINNEIYSLIDTLGLQSIHFARFNKLSGLSILEENRTLALTKAGIILLDAFDAGAEVLVIEDIEVLDMFKKNFLDIEKAVSRKITDLMLISSKNFINQLSTAVA